MIVGALLTLAAAGCHRDGLTDEQRAARRTAERYVRLLSEGQTSEALDALAYSDALSEGYRSELNDVLHEYYSGLIGQRGGVLSFAATRDTIDGTTAQVFVQVVFGDSTSEEIDVPLTLIDGEWKVR